MEGGPIWKHRRARGPAVGASPLGSSGGGKWRGGGWPRPGTQESLESCSGDLTTRQWVGGGCGPIH